MQGKKKRLRKLFIFRKIRVYIASKKKEQDAIF